MTSAFARIATTRRRPAAAVAAPALTNVDGIATTTRTTTTGTGTRRRVRLGVSD